MKLKLFDLTEFVDLNIKGLRKELNLWKKLWFVNTFILHSPLNATISLVRGLQITAERTESLVEGIQIFQIINYIKSNNQSLKRFEPPGCKDIGIRKLAKRYRD